VFELVCGYGCVCCCVGAGIGMSGYRCVVINGEEIF
jgi:hypothetical protein